MQPSDFVHLHVHSDYSLLDGACRIDRLTQAARDFGMTSVAITDHGNMFGVIEFYRAARALGLKPIVGMEAYVAPGSRFSREASARGEGAFQHLTLLCRDNKGYHNLIKLATTGYLDGFYYKPRIDREILTEHAHGLVALSGCMGGEVAQHLLRDDYDAAKRAAAWHRDLFGPDGYYLEVMDHGLSEQKKVIEGVARLSAELGIGVVATNDAHYLTRDDAEAHEVLLCINTGKFLDDEKRMSFTSDQVYFKSGDEMASLFRHMPDAVANTRKVADLCNLELFFDERHLPTFKASDAESNEALFDRLCAEGLRDRYGGDPSAEVVERLEREVGVVKRMGFVSFFLVAWDLVKTARELGVSVGPGRGSAAGSIVSYCLKITSVDPIAYGLIFERFMDETRGEAPDIDIDFCQERRERVLDYVRDRYGRDNVAQIITFGTMGARAVIRDVARVLRYPLEQTDRVAKAVPTALNVTLASALEDSPELAHMVKSDPQVRRIIDIGKRLEGLARHASTHAAGVVLADKPLHEYVPLARMGDEVTTQYAMESLEKVGLVKIDFLGLKTLTVIDRALATIRERHGVDIDLNTIDLADAKTYEMLGRGESMGVFQFESSGFRDLLKRMEPDRFADLIACVALYRPGPLGGGMVESYVNRKHGREAVNYQHPVLEQVLAPTYGVMVYQEQVMKIVNLLGDIPMSESYTLVKAISKKRAEYIEAMREKFIKGAVANGFDQRLAEGLFDQIQYFGGYGFNQSHSTAYALIAFHTAYLKAHYPREFMAAIMTHEMGDSDKLKVYVEVCRQTMDIEILPPDVNASEAGFSVTDSGVRFGLEGVKGVGGRAAESIVAARMKDGPFKSLFDFTSRVDLRVTNKGVVEALIRAGAFDTLGGRRSQYAAVVDRALSAGQRIQADRNAGQSTFFDQFAEAASADEVVENLPNLPEWPEGELLNAEEATLGFHLTKHPLDHYEPVIRVFANTYPDRLSESEDGTELTLGVRLAEVRFTVTQKGKSRGDRMAIMKLDGTPHGTCDGVLFPEDLVRNEGLVANGACVFIRGRLNLRREPPSIAVNQIISMEDPYVLLTESVVLTLDPHHQAPEAMQELRQMLGRHAGTCAVFLKLVANDHTVTTVRADSSFSVTPDVSFQNDVRVLLGEGKLDFTAIGPRTQTARNGGRNWSRN